jgi:hypothetical protein
VLLHEPTSDGVHTAYLNEGYMVGAEFAARAQEYTDPPGCDALSSVPDAEYYGRRGADDDFDVPASLDAAFARSQEAAPSARERLLRASYWLDSAYRVWHTSKSLSYIATINAVESLIPPGVADPCDCCGRDRSPGPTARFRDFVEEHAGGHDAKARGALYRLRSALVHGGGLHALDTPRAWGALTPSDMEHRELHDAALSVAGTAIRSWLSSAACDPAPTDPT